MKNISILGISLLILGACSNPKEADLYCLNESFSDTSYLKTSCNKPGGYYCSQYVTQVFKGKAYICNEWQEEENMEDGDIYYKDGIEYTYTK